MSKMKTNILKNRLFENTSDASLEKIENFQFSIQRFSAGEILIEQGLPADELVLILSGEVQISQISENGEDVFLALRKENEFIGELGLIGEGSRSSRAVCRQDTEVCKLSKKDFLKLLEEIPAISLNVTKAVAQRQKESDLLAIEKHSILQAANKNLEQKVKERTDELNSSLQTIKKDLAFAKKIQSSLMPIGQLLTEHFRFVSHYIPMQEVGGDIFDIFTSENGKVRILIADATGHGVQAALITMLIKGEYESLKKTASSPAEILKRMNSTFLERYSHVNLLFTCFIADLDFPNNMLTYCSAGHPAQILFRADKMFFLPSTGKIPGILKDAGYYEKNLEFQKGDRLFLFTDGIFEEIDSSGAEFGEDRIHSALIRSRNSALEESVSSALKELYSYLNGNPIQDDVTVIGVEYKDHT